MIGKRVFISGGAGVIGRALVEKLLTLGADVFVGDIKAKPEHWGLDVKYRQGDLNYITPEEVVTFNPDYFFHLAATFERSVESYDFWDENYLHNMRLSHHLMDCLKNSPNLKKVVFASSYLIYNPELYTFPVSAESALRLKETDVIYPRNLCGAAKLLHEVELRFLQHFNKNRYETVSARIFRVYGKSSKDVISRWIRSLLKGEKLTVYNKEGLFDYIFADQVAEGLLRLAQSGAQGIVNLGNDNARRVSDVLKVLRKHFPDMQWDEMESNDPFEASQANMDLFFEHTGWKPEVQLEEAIPQIIEHERKAAESSLPTEVERNVLVTSISKKIPLLNSLKKAICKLGDNRKIIGADVNPSCIGAYFVDKFWEMPRLSNLSIEDFVDYCKRNSINIVIPTRDGELAYFSEHQQLLLENEIYVMVSSPSSVEACLDKLKFYNELSKQGFPVIPTVDDISSINAVSYVVKERFGAGSKSIGIQLDGESATKHAKSLSSPIFQPFVQGREISVDLYIDKLGMVKGCVARERTYVVDGESQITETIRNQALEELCSNLAERLQLYGHVVMQVIIDSKGFFHIIECNSRFGGASSLSLEVGLDSFYWLILESSGYDLKDYPFLRLDVEKKLVRYSADVYF